jgi:hypothetical protein
MAGPHVTNKAESSMRITARAASLPENPKRDEIDQRVHNGGVARAMVSPQVKSSLKNDRSAAIRRQTLSPQKSIRAIQPGSGPLKK